MVLSIFTALPFTASAKEVEIAGTGTSKTQSEALTWIRSQVGKSLDYDGSYGAQCVDFVMYYYKFLGVNPSSGNGGDYTWNALPSGWQRIQGAQPQPGDVLVYTGGYGHVAIYEADYITYHQNYAGKSYVVKVTNLKYNDSRIGVPYWGVVRPNFAGTAPHTHNFYYAGALDEHPHFRFYRCDCGEIKYDYTDMWLSPTCPYCSGKISYDPTGGTLYDDEVITVNLKGVNISREAGSIVVYTSRAYSASPGNKWGDEVSFDKNGKKVAIRNYGTESSLSIPAGGFVISKHAENSVDLHSIAEKSNFAYCDYGLKKVYFFKNEHDYKIGSKAVIPGSEYGYLEEPKRDGYKFLGWFTDKDGGNQIYPTTKHSGYNHLYAHWEKVDNVVPGKSAITTFDLQNWSDGSFRLLNIEWTATANTASYEIVFYNNSGTAVKSINCGNNTSATLQYNDVPKGTYYVRIKSVNGSASNLSDAKSGEFIAPPTPTSGWVKASKYTAAVGEEITFTFGGENVTPVSNYWGTIKKDGAVVVNENWNYYTKTGRTLSFDTPGTYTAYVNVNHNSGSVNSPEITFIVYKPYKIIYDANGGTNAPASEYAAYDQDFILSNDIPSNNGHKFIAWSPYPTFLYDIDFEFSPGARLRYGELGALANDNKEVILYALWGMPVEHTILGDADGDGNVTIFDATTIQRHLADLPTQSFIEDAADCDGDGSVTVLDATAIQRHLASLPTQAKGIGEPI